MFRVLSRQAAKAVSRPSRLSTGPASRHVHSVKTPYTGPPSYDMIARRFSPSQPDPQTYFISKHLQEAKDHGEYVDFHDIGGVDPEDYDVWISDVSDEKLRGEVAETVGIPYHAMATTEDANKVVEIGDCYMYGQKFRTIFPAVVARGAQAHWVFFLVDSGSPLTYLSAQTSDLFNITAKVGPTLVKIAGYHHALYRSPSHSRFTEINILGMDFCNLYNVSQWNDFTRARAKLFFSTDWEMPVEKSKL